MDRFRTRVDRSLSDRFASSRSLSRRERARGGRMVEADPGTSVEVSSSGLAWKSDMVEERLISFEDSGLGDTNPLRRCKWWWTYQQMPFLKSGIGCQSLQDIKRQRLMGFSGKLWFAGSGAISPRTWLWRNTPEEWGLKARKISSHHQVGGRFGHRREGKITDRPQKEVTGGAFRTKKKRVPQSDRVSNSSSESMAIRRRRTMVRPRPLLEKKEPSLPADRRNGS